MHIRGARITVAAVSGMAIAGALAGCSGVQSWGATVTGPRTDSTRSAAAAASSTPSDTATAASTTATVATPIPATAPVHTATPPPAAHPSTVPTAQPSAIPTATPAPTTPAFAYKNGNYSATGTYTSPGGSETLRVTLTLGSDIVTALKVTSVKVDPTAANYEAQFESGINAVVVGKDISSLNVGTVAGSSLTSIGFNNALATIKSKAKN